jgi:hypothetical protein
MSEWVRYCINPQCQREIRACNGAVIASDILEAIEGRRGIKQIRELCGRCVLALTLMPEEENIVNFEMLLRDNPYPKPPELLGVH